MKWHWTLDKKISGLTTVLLVLLVGVCSYCYWSINEISREIAEIGQSDFHLYETATQLILAQKEKQLLLITFGALLWGLFFSTWVSNQITASVNKVTQQAQFIADNLAQERLETEALVIDTNSEFQELAQQSREMDCLAEIHQALDSERFVLFYQTIQPLQTSDSGSEHYEVLLRMEGKNGQIIPPMAFIPIAERYQLMNQIDRWVIRTLFATQGDHYRKLGSISPSQEHSVKSFYSINLSGQTVNDSNFVQFIREELDHHQIPPQLICFEITETVAISNLPQAKLMITQLKELGCRFALDDFGTGMSSFGYLNSLPVDFLKIDGIFIRGLLEEPVNRLIVQSLHQVTQGMGIATIAEFVDSESKFLQLQSLGIDYAQGDWIAKPQSLPKLPLLTTNQDVG